LLLFGGGLLIVFVVPSMMRDIRNSLSGILEHAHRFSFQPGDMMDLFRMLLTDVGLALALPFGIFVLIALGAGLAQNGVLFATKSMEPKPEKISPVAGMKRMFSAKSLAEFIKGILKIAIVAAVGIMLVMPEFSRLDILPTLPVSQLLDEINYLVLRLFTGVIAILFVIAVADLVFQRYQHRKQLRMTRQEVREEHKQLEGDPHVKARLRQIRTERARQRMMQAVPEADVVVTNPTHYAVALKYEPDEMEAPRVVAKGQDHLAQKIRELAVEHDVSIVENKPLARALFASVEVGDEVPPEHYKAVAQIISYVFNLKGRAMPAQEWSETMSETPADRPALSAQARVRLLALAIATLAAAAGLGALLSAGSGPRELAALTVATVLALGAAGAFLVLRSSRAEAAARWALAMAEASDQADGDAVAVEAPDGRIVFCNASFAALASDGAGGVMGRIGSALGGPQDEVRARLLAMRNSAESSGAVAQDFGTQDPPDRCVSVGVHRLGDGRFVWRLRDVSAMRNAQKAFQAEADRLRRQVDALPVGLYACDRDGRLWFANETFAHWVGKEAAALRTGDLRLTDVVEVEDVEGGRTLRPRDAEPVTLSTAEAPLAHDGEQLTCGVAWAKGRGPLPLRKAIFENAPVGLVVTDQDLVIQDSNALFRRLINHGAPTGHSIFDFVDADARHRLESLTRDPASAPIEVQLAREEQTVASVFAAPASGAEADGGFVFHLIDVSEQKRLEIQFAQGQKMQAVGQLAGGIAHDFNNLLTAMIGFCDLLLQHHKAGDQSFADAMQIKQNANRVAGLVRQLLAFSRQQTMKPRVLNVTDVLAELSNLLRRLLGEKIELKMQHDRDLGLVMGDIGQMEQVIINLAVNARDAMSDDGTLSIVTSNVTFSEPHEERGEVMPPGDYVCIEVSDTGMGIPADVIDHLFEPFFTTKEVGAGTGLGLSTVYGIVRQSGGYVFARSEGEGKGATFAIYLKRHEGAAVADQTAAVGEDAGDLTGGGHVLLVEDEDPVRLFSARALRSKGYQVVEARTGEAALEILGGGEENFDLLVTDMMMPKVDGATLIKEARKTMPTLPVICISGYTQESVAKEVEALPAVYFLPKPFSLKQLAAKVKEAMQKAPEAV